MNKKILVVLTVVVGAGIITFFYNYILINQLEYIIVGTFIFPYEAANDDRTHPLVYTFAKPISKEWILNIRNTLSYALRADAKVAIKLQEAVPSERFIEILMYGDTAFNRFLAALNTNETGHIILFDKKGVDGWSVTQPVIIEYDNNQHLSISIGAKVLLDRLSLNDFTLHSVVLYGKDEEHSPLNAYAGQISFEALWGRSSFSPVFYLPIVTLGVIGSLLVALLVFKNKKTFY
jgi:hypothetical protein